MKNLLMPVLLCIGVFNAIGQNIDSASISRLSPDQQKQYYQLKSDGKKPGMRESFLEWQSWP
jgi:hypothetical protein